jgi:hypothetical protein
MPSVNPFAVAGASLPADFLQWFLVIMILAVAAGTLFDMVHKRSATYFFANMRASRGKGRKLGGGELISIAAQTAAVDVATSGVFCNQKRRVAHLLGMYGFVLYVIATAVMVFGYPSGATSTPAVWPVLWWIGGLMVVVGGYWYWFFIRVDVAAEGNPVLRVMKADLFVLSLVVSVTLGLIWAGTGGGVGVIFWLYIVATIVLFCGVPWSKFAHMFYKPAAAFEKRVSRANGTAENLPTQSRDDPEQQRRHSMELLRNAPMDMGLGINREAPHHY